MNGVWCVSLSVCHRHTNTLLSDADVLERQKVELSLVWWFLGDTHGQNSVLADDQVSELIRYPLQTGSERCCRLITKHRIRLS